MTKSQGISQLISMGINDFEIAETKKALKQMLETRYAMESLIDEMKIMAQSDAPFKIEGDREKVKVMLEKTKNDLIGLNKEIMYWQDWLKQHHN